jgi:hypothetical protein
MIPNKTLHVSKQRMLRTLLLLAPFLLPFWANAQIELIPPAEGGFENGASFAANGWSTALPGTFRQWRVGTVAGAASGTNAAYVGSTTAYNGDGAAAVMHFYRDVTIPGLAYGVKLRFSLREIKVDSGNDFLRVYTTTPDHTPVSGIIPGAGYTLRGENTSSTLPNFVDLPPINLNDLQSVTSTTVRIVFTFISNGTPPPAKPAIDDVSLSYLGTFPCPGNSVVVAINTDDHADQTTWQIKDDGGALLASGGPYTGQNNTLVTDTVCLGTIPGDACYSFKIFDSFGDGLGGTGNWALRTPEGKPLIADNFPTGSVSPASPQSSGDYGTSHTFCLPSGSCDVKTTECGIYTNALDNKVFCDNVAGASQYEFEFSDPDAGFLRRIVRHTNYVHFGDISPGLTPGTHYFCRVRTNASGPLEDAHFGTGCEMGLGVAQVVTCSELISAPAYGHSCNETRPFGANGYIYAVPVQGASLYQFEISNSDAGYDEVLSSNTYILHLAWNDHPPLVNGTTYNVSVNVTVNGLETGFCPSTCTITIDNGTGGRPEQRMAPDEGGSDVSVWPNPNDGQHVFLTMDGLDDALQTVQVELFDATGRRTLATSIPVVDGRLNTTLDLKDINTGSYELRILAGDRTFNRQLLVRK